MEPSYQTRKVVGRVVALCCAAGLAAAFYAYLNDCLFKTLSSRKDTPVTVAFLTQPAMRFSYNPATRKVRVKIAASPCNAAGENPCFGGDFDLFFIPQESVQNTFWLQFKDSLATWRFNPAPLWRYAHGYINALVQKRTNVNPAHFAVLSLELAELTAADFAVEQQDAKSKKKTRQPQPSEEAPAQKAAVTGANQPLKVIILNASGKRGQAEALKQYLRAQYAKGLLQVDVYDTGNYPTLQDHSFIEDYSGRLVQVTQISHAIGITGEIHSQKPTGGLYYDSRIILGKDFKMPL